MSHHMRLWPVPVKHTNWAWWPSCCAAADSQRISRPLNFLVLRLSIDGLAGTCVWPCCATHEPFASVARRPTSKRICGWRPKAGVAAPMLLPACTEVVEAQTHTSHFVTLVVL